MRFTLLSFLCAFGCASPLPYAPDRVVSASIPAEQAVDALRRLIPKDSRTWDEHIAVGVESADPARLRIRWKIALGLTASYWSGVTAYDYATLDPHAYRLEGGGHGEYFIRLTGESIGVDVRPDPGFDCLWFDTAEAVETVLDALASLKASARR